jgi:hypothetical protein
VTDEHLTDGWEPDLPVSDTLLRPLPFDRPGDTLAAVGAFFDGHGTGEAYLWSAWPTPDLRSRGWVLEGHPPLLLRPPGGRRPAVPAVPAVGIFSDLSRPPAEALGFQALARFTLWHRPRPGRSSSPTS